MKPLLPRPISSPLRSRRQQAGAMIIEFALVAILFLTILIGIMEFGRWLFTLNAAAEATRWGARLAVVCGSSATAIQTRIGVMIRSNGTLSVVYPLPGCTTDCMVTVTLTGATFTPLIPLIPAPVGGWPMPDFRTTLLGEALGSEGPSNDVCPA